MFWQPVDSYEQTKGEREVWSRLEEREGGGGGGGSGWPIALSLSPLVQTIPCDITRKTVVMQTRMKKSREIGRGWGGVGGRGGGGYCSTCRSALASWCSLSQRST